MNKIGIMIVGALLSGCMAPTPPKTQYASENSITLRYSAYDMVPTLTSEARDIAIRHCAKYGKFANYQGANAANAMSTEELHSFACERKKTNDSEVIARQTQRLTGTTVVVVN